MTLASVFGRATTHLVRGGLVLGLVLGLSASANAQGIHCAPKLIAKNIKDAVLAVKATQYCLGHDLPYTVEDAEARVAMLRCGPQSSLLIDELLNDFEREYRTILKTDAKQVVCNMAADLRIN